MRIRLFIFSLLSLTGYLVAGVDWTVRTSNEHELVIDFTFNVSTIDDLKPIELLIGLPGDEYPELDAAFKDKQIFQANTDDLNITGVNWLLKQSLRGLNVASLQISPYAGQSEYYRNLRVNLTFHSDRQVHQTIQKADQSLLVHRIVNWNVARNWGISRIPKLTKITEYPSGTWFRFNVAEDGIIALPYDLFTNFSTVLTDRDPRSFRLFTGSTQGRDLSKQIVPNYQPIPENLIETATLITGENDGSFDVGDQIIFYGRGANGFDIINENVQFHQSIFYTENTYWLLIPDDNNLPGLRIENRESNINPTDTTNYGIVYHHQEVDIINPYETGTYWVGQQIVNGSSYAINFNLTASTLDIDPQLIVRMLGAGSGTHLIKVYYKSRFSTPIISLVWSSGGQRTIQYTDTSNDTTWQEGKFILENAATTVSSKPYFDYFTLRSSRQLTFTGNPYDFFIDPAGNAIRLNFSSTSDPIVWDITNPAVPKQLTTVPGSGGFTVDIESVADSIGHLTVFTTAEIPEVNQIAVVADAAFNSLRHAGPGVDHIIIGPNEYATALQPLVEHRGSSLFAPLEQVYREFSAGNPDPIAIRLFVQWALENWSVTHLTCLFLIGDADHDYRNITGQSKMVVPTLFLEGSLDHYYSTDDQLVTIYGPLPEVAVGRYPSHSIADVEAFVDKIIAYEDNPVPGLWRQRLTLVADDAARPEPTHGSISVGKSHTQYSERLVPYISPAVTVQKLYMMEYPEVSDASSYGVVKPAATQALFDLVNRGTAIISYIGHGSPHLWAQERLLDQSRGDLNSIVTNGRLPIWIAATCSWGHFDDIKTEAFSEDLIREPGDAAIAIITTSRPIGVNSNFAYLKNIFQRLFPNRQVTKEPIGVVLQSVKTGGISGKYFHLFGDPAMLLPLPANSIYVADLKPNPLRTLETAQFSGAQTVSTQGGVGYIMIQDADRTVTREYRIAGQTQHLTYTLPGGTLFRGQFAINDTNFNGQIRIPKDISYSDNPGKLSIYFQSVDDPPVEALGYREGLHFIGGTSLNDTEGPIITFEDRNGRIFHSGDHLILDQGLIIRLSDPIGINMAGEVGHGIIITDLLSETDSDFTNDFIYDINSITKGVIDYSNFLSGNSVDLKVTAWDNANNPSESRITLALQDSPELKLYHVLNYPNPFALKTQFTFEITAAAEIAVTIYTLQGRKIKALPKQLFSEGYHHLDWDGRDEYGGRLANGVYLYRLEASDNISKVSIIGKLAKYQ